MLHRLFLHPFALYCYLKGIYDLYQLHQRQKNQQKVLQEKIDTLSRVNQLLEQMIRSTQVIKDLECHLKVLELAECHGSRMMQINQEIERNSQIINQLIKHNNINLM